MYSPKDLEVTQILNRQGTDASSLGDVYEAMYRDIKNMASYQLSKVPSGATITPTVLAHEAYERIYQALPKDYANRTHFLRTLGSVMRNFLIDQVRAKNSLKRGEGAIHHTISSIEGGQEIAYDMIDFENALLFISEVDPQYTEILELKLLFGFTFDEVSEILKISSRQAQRRWTQAKALLVTVLADGEA